MLVADRGQRRARGAHREAEHRGGRVVDVGDVVAPDGVERRALRDSVEIRRVRVAPPTSAGMRVLLSLIHI